MKKLTALILSAAFVPALALSTAVVAENHDDMQTETEHSPGEQNGEKQRNGDWNSDKQHANEAQLSGVPSGAFYATDVIGNNVIHRGSDEDVGEINDLIIGEDGRIVGVVVTTSGFLGLGGQDAGLSWDQIEHTMEDDESVFYTDMDEEMLKNSPKFERD
ncbi:PRC-barrel domain-containing protein [Halomonas urumqiensis]|nr:PRC-barrel domain-containing protein [Halomonas urumqiensis]GHE20816.1 photosystem reaction center subunit H [Halomonas urumqiensis]